MIGNVCHRRPLEGNKLLFGVDFDSASTLDFNKKQGLIHDYVTGCQAAAMGMLRQALEMRQAG